MKKFIWAIDSSLACSGICIFNDDKSIAFLGNIPTKTKDSDGIRLKCIADTLTDLNDKYPAKVIVLERGFSRFNKATQQLNKVLGIINYIFCNVEQIYYSPSTVKKMVAGSGKAKKEELRDKIREIYPDLEVHQLDESDAIGVGLTYFLKDYSGG